MLKLLVWLHAPPLTGIGIGVLLLALSPQGPIEVSASWLGVVNVSLPLSVYPVATALVIALLVTPFFRDYSRVFSTEFDITIKFDQAGIRNTLAGFSKAERRELGIEEDWARGHEKVMALWNTHLERHGAALRITTDTFGNGHATLAARRDGNLFSPWQQYTIAEADGRAEFNNPAGESPNLILRFVRVEGNEGFRVKGTLRDVVYRWRKVIRPCFIEKVVVGPQEEFDLGRIVAATRVRFFPIPTVGRTLYFAVDPPVDGTEDQGDQTGSRCPTEDDVVAPIGYAINVPKRG